MRSARRRRARAAVTTTALLAAILTGASRESPPATADTAPTVTVSTPSAVETPANGRVAVPITFGWTGAAAPTNALLIMKVRNGFRWAATASLGERTDADTVSIYYAQLPVSGSTKARLIAPDSWDPTQPILDVRLHIDEGDSPTAATTGTRTTPAVDLFMYPPPTRTTAVDGLATYTFTYGNQGSTAAAGRIVLSPQPGYTLTTVSASCAPAGRNLYCDLPGTVPAEATLDVSIRTPPGASGTTPALDYAIESIAAPDSAPANNSGTRYLASESR